MQAFLGDPAIFYSPERHATGGKPDAAIKDGVWASGSTVSLLRSGCCCRCWGLATDPVEYPSTSSGRRSACHVRCHLPLRSELSTIADRIVRVSEVSAASAGGIGVAGAATVKYNGAVAVSLSKGGVWPSHLWNRRHQPHRQQRKALAHWPTSRLLSS